MKTGTSEFQVRSLLSSILECFQDWSLRCFQLRADVKIFPDKVCRTSSNKVALIVLTRIFGVWMRRTRNRVTGFVRGNQFFRSRQIRRGYDSLRGPQWMIHPGRFIVWRLLVLQGARAKVRKNLGTNKRGCRGQTRPILDIKHKKVSHFCARTLYSSPVSTKHSNVRLS